MSALKLNISELFHSIQGESSFAGWPCAFIRLAGCGHNCTFCDTTYAEEPGEAMQLEEVIARARSFGAPLIEITGGEPLLQPAVNELFRQLCDLGETVLLETGGFLPVNAVDPRVHKIIDLKPPSSGRVEENCLENIRLALQAPEELRRRYEFKLVLASRQDYLWARELLAETGLSASVTVMMGVIAGQLDPAALGAWILEDRLRVRMQLQLHKAIWPQVERGR